MNYITNRLLSKPKKVAIIHPKLGWGGSEAAVLWMITALKDDYDISLITSGKVDIPRLNKYYGTSLDSKDFSIIQVPMPLGLGETEKFAAVKGRLIQRYCQKLSPDFDLMISVYNPINFNKKSIQFIADFSFDQEIRQNLDSTPGHLKEIFYGNNFLRKLYLKFCDLISSADPKYWKNDLIISNSKWTAGIMGKKYGIKSFVIYPPVTGNFPIINCKNKKNGFMCLSRIVPEKKIDEVIKILQKVRQRGSDIYLHIAGELGNNRYCDYIKNLCLKYKDWIFLEGKLDEEEKKELMAKNLFGISGRANEPFGIAVAEMVKAGCIVFVPDGGGQTEIVDSPFLIYKNIEDAAQKIEAVIKDEKLQDDLRKHLTATAQKFSVESFKKEIKKIIGENLIAIPIEKVDGAVNL